MFMLLMIPFALLGALVVMLLWNAILPGLIGVGVLGYWQALGLLVLARILFGGFHRMPSRPPFLSRDWHKLSAEEREKLRCDWRIRCGWHSKPEEEA
ncbi:MAG: hypothetical protein H6505_02100 [Calditrichaeota bacterium]|nr:hypothetical protein [Calditrichota bacterium]